MALIAGVQYSGNAPGTILPCGSTGALPRTLLCDGASYSKAAYPALFAVIGTSFGSVDANSFNVPDTRGIFLRGAGSQTISSVTYTGTIGQKENDAYPAHDHGGGVHSHALNTSNAGNIYDSGSARSAVAWFGGGGNTTANSSAIIGLNGTGSETKPANLGINYCIAY